MLGSGGLGCSYNRNPLLLINWINTNSNMAIMFYVPSLSALCVYIYIHTQDMGHGNGIVI